MDLPEKIKNREENNADSVILYLPDKDNGDRKGDKSFLFQGSSGKIFINVIAYSLLSLVKKIKNAAYEAGQEFYWRTERIVRFLKSGNLHKYIPVRVFLLAIACGSITTLLVGAGTFSEVAQGSIMGKVNREAYSAVYEGVESNAIEKRVGTNLEDENWAIISSQQCKKDYENSQNSEMCGADVENKILLEDEQKTEAARLAAARAAAVRRAMASVISTTHVSCPEKNDGDPGRSQTKGKHIDEDCCPDPDEWARPGCVYSPHGYALMLKGPVKKK